MPISNSKLCDLVYSAMQRHKDSGGIFHRITIDPNTNCCCALGSLLLEPKEVYYEWQDSEIFAYARFLASKFNTTTEQLRAIEAGYCGWQDCYNYPDLYLFGQNLAIEFPPQKEI